MFPYVLIPSLSRGKYDHIGDKFEKIKQESEKWDLIELLGYRILISFILPKQVLTRPKNKAINSRWGNLFGSGSTFIRTERKYENK